MTTNAESNTAFTGQVRQAPEISPKASKNLSQKLTGHRLPSVDLTQPVARYFAPLRTGEPLEPRL
ncbi:MAG TPA: hypothetical protein VES03_00855 [Motilibacterales bacterium]|nr:hypothetical protein [Motilibacterales bacterium]